MCSHPSKNIVDSLGLYASTRVFKCSGSGVCVCVWAWVPEGKKRKKNINGLMWWGLSWEHWRFVLSAALSQGKPGRQTSRLSSRLLCFPALFGGLPSVSPHRKAIPFLLLSYLSDPNYQIPLYSKLSPAVFILFHVIALLWQNSYVFGFNAWCL